MIIMIKFKEVVEIVKTMKGKEGIAIIVFAISLNDVKKALKKKKIWLNKNILNKILKEFHDFIILFYKKESD